MERRGEAALRHTDLQSPYHHHHDDDDDKNDKSRTHTTLGFQISAVCGRMCVLFCLICAAQEDQPPLCQSVFTGPLKRLCKQSSLHNVNPPLRLNQLQLGKRCFIL